MPHFAPPVNLFAPLYVFEPHLGPAEPGAGPAYAVGMLDERRILVTGASSGIGRAIAAAYQAAGAEVWAVARHPSGLGERVHDVVADVTDPAGRQRLADAVTELDVVVHAAAILGPPNTPLSAYPEADWRAVIETNITAVQLIHQLLEPHYAPLPTIIGLSSGVGRKGRAGWGAYAVSKFALEGWMEVLAGEVPEGRVYSVNPGATRTRMRAAAAPDEDPATLPSPEAITPLFLHLAHRDVDLPAGRYDARDWIDRDPWDGLA